MHLKNMTVMVYQSLPVSMLVSCLAISHGGYSRSSVVSIPTIEGWWNSCRVNSHPSRKLSLDFGHFLGCALLLVIEKLYGWPQACLLGFSGMFPACVDHHAEHQQTGADTVVTGQVDGQQGSQTFPERPEHRDCTYPLGLLSFCLRGARCLLLGVACAGTFDALWLTRLGFFALHSGLLKPRNDRL